MARKILKTLESIQYEARPYIFLSMGFYAIVNAHYSSFGAILGLLLMFLAFLIINARYQYRNVTGAKIERDRKLTEQRQMETSHGIELANDDAPTNSWEEGVSKN